MAGDKVAADKSPGSCSWEGVFHFHPEDGIYRDHFPGYPVVPGSLIVNAFMEAAANAGFLPENLIAEDFRFREFLLPGLHSYRMELKVDRLNCLIYRGKRKLVTGVLKR